MGFDGVSPYRGDGVAPNDWNRGSGLNSYAMDVTPLAGFTAPVPVEKWRRVVSLG
jgi:hypothetical protein